MIKHVSALAVCIVLGIGAAGCSGGSGQSASGPAPANSQNPAPSGTSPSPNSPAPADYSSMLVGHWVGHMFNPEDKNEDVRFYPDGTCGWTVEDYDPTYNQVHQGWLWSVSGATELPDWASPWIVQLRPGPQATASDSTSAGDTVRVIAIDAHGFTAYQNIEHADFYLDMTRAP